MVSSVIVERRVKEAQPDVKELLAWLESTETREQRVWRVPSDFRGQRDQKEKQETWDPLEGVARMVLMGVRVLTEREEAKVPQGKTVPREKLET